MTDENLQIRLPSRLIALRSALDALDACSAKWNSADGKRLLFELECATRALFEGGLLDRVDGLQMRKTVTDDLPRRLIALRDHLMALKGHLCNVQKDYPVTAAAMRFEINESLALLLVIREEPQPPENTDDQSRVDSPSQLQGFDLPQRAPVPDSTPVENEDIDYDAAYEVARKDPVRLLQGLLSIPGVREVANRSPLRSIVANTDLFLASVGALPDAKFAVARTDGTQHER